MTLGAWAVFAAFWAVFVTTPGPNAANCIETGMRHGLPRGLWAVAGILTQSALFLTLAAAGVAAAIAAAPALLGWLKLAGAAVLVWLGLRTFLAAGRPLAAAGVPARSIYGRALLVATINSKSLAGYLAAFTQFVQPGPIAPQMWAIAPTALAITAASYSGYTALGAWLGRRAQGALLSAGLRRGLGAAFVVYGALLGWSGLRAA